MNTNLIEIDNETVELSAEFTSCQQVTNDLILPLLKKVETSKWNGTPDRLLTIAIDGADISNRSQIHCDISRIYLPESRKTATLLDDHIDDIGVQLKYWKENRQDGEIYEALTKQFETGTRLVANLKEAIYQFTLEALE
ncbi:MAG: hypothetical protein P1V20_03580 [Verrucomicrobiales bacterium]|nr:hypothetical protein [Verrucomicrobiales bacterium]